jgi:putative ABC transport system permease protein
MLRHFWNSAVRNLFRNKVFTVINIVGLSLSIAVCLALIGYVRYELSYDQFYNDGDRVYRIDYYEYQDGQAVLESARTHDRTMLLAHEYVPQVEAATRILDEKAYVFTEDVKIIDQNMLYADSSFFKVFDVEMVHGDPNMALVPPKAVVISESAAQQYFGEADPMGKTLYFNERLPFMVTGVFKDIPETSSIDYDFVLSWSTLWYYGWVPREGSFKSPYTFTYVKLKSNADVEAVNRGLSRMANDHITTLSKLRHTAKHELRPYTQLHVMQPLTGEIKPPVNKSLLYAFISLSVFILVAAWINYVNLSLAQSLTRAGEIGVRKVFGASGIAISGQFILEAVILSTSTFVVGVIVYFLFTGPLSHLIFVEVAFEKVSVPTWMLFFLCFVAGTTLASFYPSHFMSRLKPVMILRNKLGNSRGKANLLQHGLMVFQLFLAVAVIGITFIAQRQLGFMRNFDSGFNTKATIALRGPASTNSDSLRYVRYTSFRNEVLQQKDFVSGTASMNIPGQEIRFHGEGVYAVGSNNELKQSLSVMWIDNGYQETFGMTLAAGRNFNLREEGLTCIINETAAKALGYGSAEAAVNNSLAGYGNNPIMIIGVWKDYHHESVHKPVIPIMFLFKHPHEYGYYSFQLGSTHANFMPGLKKIWDKHYPNDTFTCYFMDSFFEEQYRSDRLFGKLLGLFGVISILVACLGLFGMASLAMVKRTKEIGVRKVLGASVFHILLMLSRNYVKLIVISSMFAFPMVWFATARWLQEFRYKIDVTWWMIIVPGLIVLVAALITIAGQTIRTAASDPAKVLRDQ